MKQLVAFVLLLITSTFAFSEEKIHYTEIVSFDGVNLRSAASTKASIVTKLPYATMVRLLGGAVEDTINGEKGYWIRVAANGIEGFVFNRFVGLTDSKSAFLNQVYLDQTQKQRSSDNYIFHSETLKLLQVFKNFYVASFDLVIPKGQDGPDPRLNYAIYVLDQGVFKAVFQRNTWGFQFIQLLDIDSDGSVDLLAKHGGCCGSLSYIGVSLGSAETPFPDMDWKKVVRTSESRSDAYESYCGEDFYYDDRVNRYIVIGRKAVEGKNEENFYYDYFDIKTKQFLPQK